MVSLGLLVHGLVVVPPHVAPDEDPDTLGRTGILAFVVIVWAVQLAWSKPWLDRFRFGPAEWLWHSATYRRSEPFRPSTSTGQSQQLRAGE